MALSVPGIANAKTTGPSNQCSGSNIGGQGAAVMNIAIGKVLAPDFNTSANPDACNGTQGTKGTPKVTYTQTSSGQGLESWGVNKHAASFALTNAFVATEEPPNPAQKGEIEANETTSTPETVQTIPVLQEAISVDVNLPSGCTANSTAAPGRLVLDNTTLAGIWDGEITTWGQITDGGDTLTGAGCGTAPITRVVRLDSAGTTHILKKYLFLIDSNPFQTESGGTANWNEISEGTANTAWPKADAVVRPGKTGDSAEVAKIAETPGSIGYAALANTRANAAFYAPKGGPGTGTFWVEVQNSGTSTTKAKYSDPSTDGEVEAPAEAHCAKTKYTNGTGTKFPPKSTADSWAEVTTATKEKAYTLCGLAYELALSKYSAYPGTEALEAVTAENFLTFELQTKSEGGQALILNHDYEPLPKNLVKEALAGAASIAF
jgi:ABC-type phosphate transport system substrate-binding protein